MDPATIAAIGGLLQGFGGGSNEPEVPMGMRWILPLLKRNARYFEQYAQGVPGSDPGEAATLASARALLGQQFGNQREGLLAMADPNMDPGARGDMFANLGDSENAQVAALIGGLMNQFRTGRQNARLTATGIAQGAGGAVPFQQNGSGGVDFAGLLGQYAQNSAYMKALGGARAPATSNATQYGTGGGRGPFDAYTQR